jgi:hypothetical protein
VVRKGADVAFDALGKAGEALRKTSKKLQRGYDKVRSLFGKTKPSSPVVACQKTSDPGSDMEADGWLMAPTEAGCSLIAQSEGASKARGQASQSQSECCKKRRAAGEATRDIVYVNGIQTTREDHCKTLHAIANQTCARVIGVYNATAGKDKGGFSRDAAQTGQDRRLIKAANEGKPISSKDGRNPAVDSLTELLVEECRQGRSPEIWAHSQGGAITSLALIEADYQLATELGEAQPLAKLKVKSLGSAAPAWPDGPKYEHYVHVNDFTPTSFGLGSEGKEDGANTGLGAKVVRFSGDPKSTTPFDDRAPQKTFLAAGTANHGVEDTYLRMEKQKNGGCP